MDCVPLRLYALRHRGLLQSSVLQMRSVLLDALLGRSTSLSNIFLFSMSSSVKKAIETYLEAVLPRKGPNLGVHVMVDRLSIFPFGMYDNFLTGSWPISSHHFMETIT